MVIQNKNPLATVIIPVFNSEKYLLETLQSVFKQHYYPFEVIVVDNHSSDKTESICKNFTEINFFKQPGKGISDALNYGIEKSRGEYISFISYDDIWMPEKLRRQINDMTENPEIKYTITKVKYFLELGCKLPNKFNKKFLEESYEQYILENLVARKSLFDEIGTFDCSFTSGLEIDWFAKAKDKNIQYAIINEVLVKKRVHDSNTSLNTVNPMHQHLKAMRNSISRKKNKTSCC
ncbi:MAG: glycosyltransferase family 2 protein [Thermodesulfobacteriota bacterium]